MGLPNGIIGRLYGPTDGRRHDITLARESGLNAELRHIHDALLPLYGTDYVTYGDPAYIGLICPWLLVGYAGTQLTSAQTDFNSRMSSVRVSVEWLFGDILRSFAYLDWKRNLRVLLQPVAKYYLVGALLTNFRACLYGNSTSEFFGLETPDLENYVSGHP